MKKIVELLIDWDNVDFDDLGVEVMSIVDKPAIGIDFLAFSEEAIVDNTGFEKFETFFNENLDLFKKPGGGAAGEGGVNHAEQMKLLAEAGINTEYPFGYCYQVAQFLFYAMGGYNGPYDLKCIKKMQYKVEGQDFEATHWYIQHKETHNIVDLTASQFDGILDINDYYSEGKRANLGFPYYNVNGQRVEFDNTVPSFQSLKLYSKWREDSEKLKELEKYYVASKYEELRKDFAEHEFVEPKAGEEHDPFMGRCISVVVDEGYESDQAAAICHSYWEEAHGPTEMSFVDEEQVEMETFILGLMEEFGETVDYEKAVYVDTSKSGFENIGDYVKGIVGLDILGRQDLDSEPEIKYRYSGPSAERNFCKAMMRLNKLYTRQEIREMDSRINTGFRHNGNPYSIFDFKGGVNCNHYWEELEVYRDGRETVIMSKGRANGRAGQVASSSNDYWRYPGTFAFSSDEEMIVTGPAMVPQQLILRKDEMGNAFHVYFSKDTIKKIARKFFEYNKQNQTDINHDDNITTNNTLLESWIVEDPKMDKSTAMGFEVPAGTWFASYKINDQETWNKIKSGELNGYSIAGNFIEKAAKL